MGPGQGDGSHHAERLLLAKGTLSLSHTHTRCHVWVALQDGRLGHRNTDSSLVPLKVKELEQYCIVEAACGGLHTAALTGSSSRSSLGLV